MFVTTRLLLLLFFIAIRLLLVVDTAHAQTTNPIAYRSLNPDKPAARSAYPGEPVIGSSEGDISVGSSVTTDDASASWMSSSGRFSFGFYREKDSFSVGIQLLISPSETVVVWTARPDLINRFSKDAFLNFTDEGLFVTPEKGANAFLLVNFSSTATSADMLDDGNFVVFGNISNIYGKMSDNSISAAAARPGNPYTRGCTKINSCRSGSDNTISIWRSFDFPTDTILENQILPCGYNLTSSASMNSDHSIGEYILNLPCDGANNLISYRRLNSADKINWDSGASFGHNSSLNLDGEGRLYLISAGGYEKDLSGYKPKISSTQDDILYRATLDSDGFFRVYAHNLNTNSTMMVDEIPYQKDSCQAKDICGVNSYCFLANSNAQCNCMPGFNYIDPHSHVAGCRRNQTVPSCISLGSAAAAATAAIFSMETVHNIAGMDVLAYGVVSTASQEDCSNACLNDCICDAASFIDQKCLKLKLPLTSGRKDDSHTSFTFIKLAAGGQLATARQGRGRREIRFAAIFISAAVTISIWIVVIAALVGAYWLLFVRFREEWRKWELALTEEIAPRYFSYEELRKGSNEFNQPLGKGGHGTVYRAELPIGDRTVAVALKKLHGAEMEGEKEFQAEMSLIGRACHANLVRLLGFCHDGPSKIIAYELMSRGSLANHIFESRGRRPSWERRIAILIDAARGIQYLHSECDTKIIHRDIKPENILISENWTAKIADFGLAKLLNINQTRAATRTLAAGTEGYVAPEYCEQVFDETGEAQVTEKADVYSYGIVVLETICSKRNREVRLSLRELVWKSYEANELSKLVDREEVPESFDQLEKLVKVGLLCVQEDPNARPFMEDVVMMLEGYIDVPTPLPTVPLMSL